MKRIAAVALVGNDDRRMLEYWVNVFSERFGAENMYIYFEGLDSVVPAFCESVHCHRVELGPCNSRAAGRMRRKYLSERAAELFDAGYEMVSGVDFERKVNIGFRRSWFGMRRREKKLQYGEESVGQA